MTIAQALHSFFVDARFQAALVLVSLDVVLGILAAFKAHTFKLNWVGDFLKTDVLFKLVPWGAVYIAAKYAGHQQLVIPQIDIDKFADAAYAFIAVQWAASIAKSLADLGFPIPAALGKLLAPEHPPLPPTP